MKANFWTSLAFKFWIHYYSVKTILLMLKAIPAVHCSSSGPLNYISLNGETKYPKPKDKGGKDSFILQFIQFIICCIQGRMAYGRRATIHDRRIKQNCNKGVFLSCVLSKWLKLEQCQTNQWSDLVIMYS